MVLLDKISSALEDKAYCYHYACSDATPDSGDYRDASLVELSVVRDHNFRSISRALYQRADTAQRG
jgi:hypothetical protein